MGSKCFSGILMTLTIAFLCFSFSHAQVTAVRKIEPSQKVIKESQKEQFSSNLHKEPFKVKVRIDIKFSEPQKGMSRLTLVERWPESVKIDNAHPTTTLIKDNEARWNLSDFEDTISIRYEVKISNPKAFGFPIDSKLKYSTILQPGKPRNFSVQGPDKVAISYVSNNDWIWAVVISVVVTIVIILIVGWIIKKKKNDQTKSDEIAVNEEEDIVIGKESNMKPESKSDSQEVGRFYTKSVDSEKLKKFIFKKQSDETINFIDSKSENWFEENGAFVGQEPKSANISAGIIDDPKKHVGAVGAVGAKEAVKSTVSEEKQFPECKKPPTHEVEAQRENIESITTIPEEPEKERLLEAPSIIDERADDELEAVKPKKEVKYELLFYNRPVYLLKESGKEGAVFPSISSKRDYDFVYALSRFTLEHFIISDINNWLDFMKKMCENTSPFNTLKVRIDNLTGNSFQKKCEQLKLVLSNNQNDSFIDQKRGIIDSLNRALYLEDLFDNIDLPYENYDSSDNKLKNQILGKLCEEQSVDYTEINILNRIYFETAFKPLIRRRNHQDNKPVSLDYKDVSQEVTANDPETIYRTNFPSFGKWEGNQFVDKFKNIIIQKKNEKIAKSYSYYLNSNIKKIHFITNSNHGEPWLCNYPDNPTISPPNRNPYSYILS